MPTERAPHNMSDNTTPSPYVASASSVFGAPFDAFAAFDATAGNTSWLCAGGVLAGWLKIDFGSGQAFLITNYDVWPAAGQLARSPKDWTLEGSTDDSTWHVIDTVTGASFVDSFTPLACVCDVQTTAYRYIRMNITSTQDAGAFCLSLTELYLQGEPAASGGTHTLSVVQTGANVGADAGDPSWTGMNGDPGTGVATIDTASPSGAHVVAVFLQADASAYPLDTIDRIDMVATATVSGPGTGLEVSFNSTDAIVPVGTLYTQQLILENDLQNWPLVQPTLTAFIETTGVGEVILTVTEVHLVVTLTSGGGGTVDIHNGHLLCCIIGSPCARLFV